MPIYGEIKEYCGRKYKNVSEINGIQFDKITINDLLPDTSQYLIK